MELVGVFSVNRCTFCLLRSVKFKLFVWSWFYSCHWWEQPFVFHNKKNMVKINWLLFMVCPSLYTNPPAKLGSVSVSYVTGDFFPWFAYVDLILGSSLGHIHKHRPWPYLKAHGPAMYWNSHAWPSYYL